MPPRPPQAPAQAEPVTQAAAQSPDWDALLESPASLALLDHWVAQAQAELAQATLPSAPQAPAAPAGPAAAPGEPVPR